MQTDAVPQARSGRLAESWLADRSAHLLLQVVYLVLEGLHDWHSSESEKAALRLPTAACKPPDDA